MKATDLMINDLVQCEGCSTPSVVAGITPGKIHTWWADGTKHAKDEVYFTPIPLTEEILEKNGFEYGTSQAQRNFAEIVTGGIPLPLDTKYHTPYEEIVLEKRVEKEDGEEWVVWDIEGFTGINYVHELQNVARIYGLDELADNFKI